MLTPRIVDSPSTAAVRGDRDAATVVSIRSANPPQTMAQGPGLDQQRSTSQPSGDGSAPASAPAAFTGTLKSRRRQRRRAQALADLDP